MKKTLLLGAAVILLNTNDVMADLPVGTGTETATIDVTFDIVRPKELSATDMYLGKIVWPGDSESTSISIGIDAAGNTTFSTGNGDSEKAYVVKNGTASVITGVTACNEIYFSPTVDITNGTINGQSASALTKTFTPACSVVNDEVRVYGTFEATASSSVAAIAGEYAFSFNITAVYPD